MVTKLPRIFVTCSEETYGVVKRLAQAEGASMSGVVVDLIEDNLPRLIRRTEILEISKKLHGSERARLKRIMAALEYKYADKEITSEEILQEMIAALKFEKTEGQLDIEDYLPLVDSENAA